MYLPTSGFSNLPKPLQAGAILAGGGGLCAAIYFLLSGNREIMWIILIGLALVVLLLLAYKMLLKWFDKRKSKDFQGGVEIDSAQKPGGVSKAEQVARLDDLQKKFEEGIEKFRVAGKDIYSLPWVMIVGEPGSGKTEAVRHCNVGFPPGLHEPLQGTGGTINMNWWFTDHSVLLDTAGRLMFEEVEPGKTTEWQHFLNLLKRYRRNCPVNGVLLVIPADTLSTDTADEIGRKAEKIAQQFDMIQRTLDVRFPVFVVVAKTDRIDGFREFFDDLTDPQLQHQILGWSNPAPLDDPFDPESINSYLQTIQGRLQRFRTGLLRDPIPSGESTQRRTDEVDALYAFPQQLLRVAPRLRRYLELIFGVGGQWSGKPLFFRGIYFTSSMREGEALDVELAENLDVPVESLPDGKVWEKDRAYFLRDLFMNKIFRERGLVTSATNAQRQHRWRKTVVMGAAALSAALLLFFTLFGVYSLDKNIGKVSEDFVVARDQGKARYWPENDNLMYWFPIVEQNPRGSITYKYTGDQPPFKSSENSSIRFLEELRNQVDKGVKIPPIFFLAQLFQPSIKPERLVQGQKTLFEAAVLRPLVDAARWKMVGGIDFEPPSWTPQATEALAQLIRLEAIRSGNVSTPAMANQDAMYQWPGPLLDYIFHDSDLLLDEPRKEQFEQDKDTLNSLAKSIYEEADVRLPDLLSLHNTAIPQLARQLAAPDKAIRQGVESYIQYCRRQGGIEGPLLKGIEQIEVDLTEFESAEQKLLELAQDFASQQDQIDTSQKLDSMMEPWNQTMKKMESSAARVNQRLEVLQDQKLDQAYEKGVQEAIRKMQGLFEPLLNELPAQESQTPQDPQIETEPRQETKENILTWVRGQFVQVAQDVSKERLSEEHLADLKQLQTNHLELVEQQRLYQIRTKIWRLGHEQLNYPIDVTDMAQWAKAVDDITEQIKSTRGQIPDLAPHQPYLVKETADAIETILNIAQRRQTSLAMKQALDSLPQSPDDISKYVDNLPTDNSLPKIPLTRFEGGGYNRLYAPEGAAHIFDAYSRLQKGLNNLDTPLLDRDKLVSSFNDFKQGYDVYVRRYYNHWANTIPQQLQGPAADWNSYYEELKLLTTFSARTSLDALGKKMQAAFEAVQGAAPTDDLNKNIQDALNHVKNNQQENYNLQLFEPQCNKILRNLIGLGKDPFRAAQSLIQEEGRDLSEKFIIIPPNNIPKKAPLPVEFAYYYWYNLNRSVLQFLVDEVDTQRRQSIMQLRKISNEFPLIRPQSNNMDYMSPSEIAQARQLYYDRINFAGVDITGQNVTDVRTGIDDMDKLYGNLRRPGLSDSDSQWLGSAGKVLLALPSQPGEFASACSVSLLKNDAQEALLAEHKLPGGSSGAHLISPIWRNMTLKQGTLEKTIDTTAQAQDVSLLKLNYSSDGVVFNFFYFIDDTNPDDRSFSVEGPWAPMRLLHQGTVSGLRSTEQQPLSCSWWPIPPKQVGQFLELEPGEDPNKVWLVKLALSEKDDPKKRRWICLKLVFDDELPDPENWPTIK